MTKKFQTASLLLLTALLASTVVSCGAEAASGSAGDGADADGSAAVTAETEPVETHPMITALADADYDGYSFGILGEQMRDHIFVEEPDGDVINDAIYRRNTEIEERYNVKLDYNIVAWKEAPAIIQSEVMAGDSTYDLTTSTHLYLGSALTGNYFRDWSSIPNIDLSKPYYVADANKTYSIGDKTMLLFGDFMDSNINCCWVYVFNKRLAGDYDLPDLYEIVDSGKWTIDTVISLVKDVETDLNGDGVMDDSDFYGFSTDIYAAVDSYTRTFGLSAISKNAENYPVLDFFKESTVDAYTTLFNLYYNTPGVHYVEGAFAQIAKSFIPGNAIFSNGLMNSLYSADMRDMKDDYGVLPYPKLNESQEGYYTYLDGTFSSQMVLVSSSEDKLDRTGMITEALNAYSYEYVRSAIYDTALKVKAARDEASIRMLDLVLDGRRFSFDSFDENSFKLSPTNALRSNIQGKKDSIASYYEKNQKSCEKWVTSMIDAFNASSN